MPEQPEYERDRYKVDHDLLKFYDAILQARIRTAKALNKYRAAEKGINIDLLEQVEKKKDAETVFLNYLDLYYDLVKFKFQKADDVEKPEFMDDETTVHSLDADKAITLYNKLNNLLEELEITSLENLDKGRRMI